MAFLFACARLAHADNPDTVLFRFREHCDVQAKADIPCRNPTFLDVADIWYDRSPFPVEIVYRKEIDAMFAQVRSSLCFVPLVNSDHRSCLEF